MVVGKAPIQIREDCCGSGSGKIMRILLIRTRILSAQGLPQIKGSVEEGKVEKDGGGGGGGSKRWHF